MKILITGGTGFIGKRLIERLTNTDHNVFCLVRRINPVSDKLQKLGVKIVVGDITDKASVLHGMKGCDWVFHLAGLYSFWEPDNLAYKEINVTGTRNVMECALEANITKVVHVSTVGIFGKPKDDPFTEESDVGPIRFGKYFQTKYEGELIVWDLYTRKGLPVVVVYPGAVLGAGDPKASGQYIMSLLRRRLPATVFIDGVLTYVHVKDVAEVIIRAAEKNNNIGEKYIAGKERKSFREINHMVHDISGVSLPKLSLPNSLTMINAALLTALANVIKKPPLWGMSLDQMKVMREGFRADGSKAERDLDICYTPVRTALEETIASFRE